VNATETAKLCAAIAQSAPAQKFDDDTPAFWAVLLEDVRYEDAREAVVRLLKRQPFVAPADIVAEVKVIRDDRLDRTELPVPNVDPDDPRAHLDEIRALRSAIADGAFDADAYAKGDITLSGHQPRPAITAEVSKPRAVEAATRSAFRAVPAPTRDDYAAKAPDVPATVSPDLAAAQEAVRAASMAALVARYGPSVADGAPTPAGRDEVAS
jgi:hypothetical protein